MESAVDLSARRCTVGQRIMMPHPQCPTEKGGTAIIPKTGPFAGIAVCDDRRANGVVSNPALVRVADSPSAWRWLFALRRRLGPLPVIPLGGVGSGRRNPTGNKPNDFITLLKRISDTKDAAIWRSPLDLARRIDESEIRTVLDFRTTVENQIQPVTGIEPHCDAVLTFPTIARGVPLDLFGDRRKRFEDCLAQCPDHPNTLVRKLFRNSSTVLVFVMPIARLQHYPECRIRARFSLRKACLAPAENACWMTVVLKRRRPQQIIPSAGPLS
ncbi:hypothetical protein ACI7BZ_10530 [Xanthobacter sp. AM11]|uniref:hypothetical protein n=1 Tax=Xanthobacter sp. AM11 TaxID=3380643 RepID=UPI0039BFF105